MADREPGLVPRPPRSATRPHTAGSPRSPGGLNRSFNGRYSSIRPQSAATDDKDATTFMRTLQRETRVISTIALRTAEKEAFLTDEFRRARDQEIEDAKEKDAERRRQVAEERRMHDMALAERQEDARVEKERLLAARKKAFLTFEEQRLDKLRSERALKRKMKQRQKQARRKARDAAHKKEVAEFRAESRAATLGSKTEDEFRRHARRYHQTQKHQYDMIQIKRRDRDAKQLHVQETLFNKTKRSEGQQLDIRRRREQLDRRIKQHNLRVAQNIMERRRRAVAKDISVLNTLQEQERQRLERREMDDMDDDQWKRDKHAREEQHKADLLRRRQEFNESLAERMRLIREREEEERAELLRDVRTTEKRIHTFETEKEKRDRILGKMQQDESKYREKLTAMIHDMQVKHKYDFQAIQQMEAEREAQLATARAELNPRFDLNGSLIVDRAITMSPRPPSPRRRPTTASPRESRGMSPRAPLRPQSPKNPYSPSPRSRPRSVGPATTQVATPSRSVPAPCGCCDRDYPAEQLTGQTTHKAIMDQRKRWGADPAAAHFNSFAPERIYDAVRLCVFCSQFFTREALLAATAQPQPRQQLQQSQPQATMHDTM